MALEYDFCGWATRNNIKCSDGRTILRDAFKDNDGQTVPLVWNHNHDDSANVLGHALLENREDGVYTYGVFNDTEAGRNAKELVQHGDITALSIYANHLKQRGGEVIHGAIREVSLVLAGANVGAYIEDVIAHSDEEEYSAVIFTGEDLAHADTNSKEENKEVADAKEETKEASKETSKERTVKDVYNEMTDEQKTVVDYLVGMAIQEKESGSDEEDTAEHSEEGDTEEMKHNAFSERAENEAPDMELFHSEINEMFKDAKRLGSLKDAFLQHEDNLTDIGTSSQSYGIGNIDYLFPDAQAINKEPEFIKRETTWVAKVMGGVHHTPFSRIKSIFADITEDEARAKGYIKGKLKKEEVFGLLKRTTTPTTIYKKQKLDRDDIIDIVDLDVVAWIKAEMRVMLDEEIARAILIGDGRSASSDDKINETNIRPILTDADLFTIKYNITYESGATDNDKAKQFIRSAIKARKQYKGSGTPTLFTTEDQLTEMLLIEDVNGRRIYESIQSLATALRVSDIVTVEVMEGCQRSESGTNYDVLGLIVNLADYNVGADKGGAVSMFDDFDIDYNQQKYLIETRISGALTKPYSAIVLETAAA